MNSWLSILHHQRTLNVINISSILFCELHSFIHVNKTNIRQTLTHELYCYIPDLKKNPSTLNETYLELSGKEQKQQYSINFRGIKGNWCGHSS